MNRGSIQDFDPPLATEPPVALRGGHPIALAIIAIASLCAFGAAGWSLGRMRAGGTPPAAADEPAATTEPKAIARGRLVYQVQCARCHGPSGHGDGSDAPLFKTPPRDLAAVVATRSDGVLRRSITDGIAGTPMTGFGQLLSTRELDSLLQFVRSLGPAPAPVSDAAATSDPMPARLAEMLEHAGFVPDARWRPAPRLDVRDVEGRVTSLNGMRGSVVLVVFWGTSCGSCVSELPELEQLADQYRPAGLRVLPVCLDQTVAADAQVVAKGHAKNLPVFVDPNGFARLRYDVQGLPTAVLIDRQGRILGKAQGAKNWTAAEVHTLVASCLDGRD
jgi:mono/diheme cytochrome c family protein/peroxiredoxin